MRFWNECDLRIKIQTNNFDQRVVAMSVTTGTRTPMRKATPVIAVAGIDSLIESRKLRVARSLADLAEDVKKLTVPQLLAAASLSAQAAPERPASEVETGILGRETIWI